MSQLGWSEHVKRLHSLLDALSCRDSEGNPIATEECFEEWRKLTIRIREKRQAVFLVGNGASASMASHMAADLAKNARLHTEVFSDLALITAISNDMGYEHVFSEPLSRRAKAGDMLVAISSSGRSENVLSAAKVAKEMELTIVTLSAMDEDNPLRSTGTLNLYVPAKTYGYAESCHAVLLHHWMSMVEKSGTAAP